MSCFGLNAGRISAVLVVVVGVMVASSLYAERDKNNDSDTYLIWGDVYDAEGTEVPGALVYLISEGDSLKGKSNRSGYYAINIPITTSVSGNNSPAPFSLGQNYPNPFNPSTTIRFVCSKHAAVRLDVFNILGQRIATLAEGRFLAGEHSVIWDGTNDGDMSVSAGVYLYRLSAGSFTETRKMLLLDGGHVSSSTVRTSISGQSAKIAAPPEETVYEIFCEKSGVGSVQDTVAVTFDKLSFEYNIKLPGVYEPPQYAQLEGRKYVVLVSSNGGYGFRWICQFEYGDYYASDAGTGHEEGTYYIEGDTITITITDSVIPDRIGLTFDVEILLTEADMLQVTLSNAEVLTMGIVEGDTVRIVVMPV